MHVLYHPIGGGEGEMRGSGGGGEGEMRGRGGGGEGEMRGRGGGDEREGRGRGGGDEREGRGRWEGGEGEMRGRGGGGEGEMRGRGERQIKFLLSMNIMHRTSPVLSCSAVMGRISSRANFLAISCKLRVSSDNSESQLQPWWESLQGSSRILAGSFEDPVKDPCKDPQGSLRILWQDP